MSKLAGFWTRLRRAIARRGFEQQMSGEMRAHLEQETAWRISQGEDPGEARRHAALEFGQVDAHKERVRDRRLGRVIADLISAGRFAVRRLRRTPAFTLTALGTLALCIGANVAIFAVVDAIVVRPLPFPEPDRLVSVINSYPTAGFPRAGPSIPDYLERRAHIAAFSSVAMLAPVVAVVGEPGSVQRVEVGRVTPEFFATLGVPLAKGESFTDAALTYQTDQVAVLTDEFWRAQFAATPDIIGRTFVADGIPQTVIGVLPPGFRFLSSRAHYFKPLSHQPAERSPANRHNSLAGMVMIARLAAGATLAEAQAQLDALNARLAETDPQAAQLEGWGYHSRVQSLHADFVRDVSPALLLLQAGVLVLLLIGGVNLTNLLLVRASGRTRELAVRQALGAGRFHLTRDALVETLLLALAGGALGLGLGALGIRLLATLGADQLPLGAEITFDGRIAVVALLGALALGVALAGPTLWFTRRLNLNARLQSETAGGTASVASHRLRQCFSVVQIGLAFVLLTGAGLLGLSWHRVLREPIGFEPDHILTGELTLPWKRYRGSGSHVMFVERLVAELNTLPGVSAAAVNNSMPFAGGVARPPVTVEGQSTRVRGQRRAGVTPDYWRVMKIPLLRGELLDDANLAQRSRAVCVIDQTIANTYWPGEDPIGRRLCFDSSFDPDKAFIVVGVVGDTKQSQLSENTDMGMIYCPWYRFPTGFFRFAVRTQVPPETMAASVREAVRQLDAELVVADLKTMEQNIADSLVGRRSPTILAAAFAGIALLLASIGTYGVLAYAVSHRRREIGVRMALGALPRQILSLFLGAGLRMLIGGVILGALGIAAVGRVLQGFLYGVDAYSPATIGGVAVIMGLVVSIAIAVPACRAANVHPNETLRHE